jgi:uncharacterized protein DUF922
VAVRVQTVGPVTWTMFRAVGSIPDTDEEAQINPEISPVPNLQPQRTPGGKFRMPSFTFSVNVNRTNTMILRTAAKTADLLKHEQGHYDLLVLVARALAREVESLETDSVQELGTQLAAAMQTHNDRAQAVDALYDKETDHSRNRTAQQRWDTAISAALANPAADKIANLPL